MKRIVSLVFALVLVLSALCGAAAAEKTFKTAYFTLKLPNGWDFDTEDTGVEEDDEYWREEYLGACYEDKEIGMVLTAYYVYYKDGDLKDIQMWNANDEELQEYEEEILDIYRDDDAESLGIVKADRIPFILIKVTDQDGEYMYAHTMANGYAIMFYAWIEGADGETIYPITDKHAKQFKNILETLQPVI